jgi:hypothetical protein
MSQVRPVLRSRTAADRAALAARLAATGRVQIPGLLDDASAETLRDEAAVRTPFQTVTLGGKGPTDCQTGNGRDSIRK